MMFSRGWGLRSSLLRARRTSAALPTEVLDSSPALWAQVRVARLVRAHVFDRDALAAIEFVADLDFGFVRHSLLLKTGQRRLFRELTATHVDLSSEVLAILAIRTLDSFQRRTKQSIILFRLCQPRSDGYLMIKCSFSLILSVSVKQNK